MSASTAASTLVERSLTRTMDAYLANYSQPPTSASGALKATLKQRAEYGILLKRQRTSASDGGDVAVGETPQAGDRAGMQAGAPGANAGALQHVAPDESHGVSVRRNLQVGRRAPRQMIEPEWHAPWKLMRVISGHLGWVRSVAIDPTNQWFATGSNDRTIKIWDLASGTLKLTLTGHISTVRALCISDRHPYLFSAGDDKMVKCWDLETNRTVRSYHGHLSGVFCASLHPHLDVLCTGGRDSCVRVWDMRTTRPIYNLAGHQNTIGSLATQAAEPQIISGSFDTTVRLWDLAAGKSRVTLTNHKKGVRALAVHPGEYTFVSAAADNIKKWKCPDGVFLQNLSGHNSIINAVCVNEDSVLVSAGDNGSLHFWDWKTGHCFQKQMTIAQPGSLESEHGIHCCTFDRSGARLITGETDKTIKIWREDDKATPQTHPVVFVPPKDPKRF